MTYQDKDDIRKLIVSEKCTDVDFAIGGGWDGALVIIFETKALWLDGARDKFKVTNSSCIAKVPDTLS